MNQKPELTEYQEIMSSPVGDQQREATLKAIKQMQGLLGRKSYLIRKADYFYNRLDTIIEEQTELEQIDVELKRLVKEVAGNPATQ